MVGAQGDYPGDGVLSTLEKSDVFQWGRLKKTLSNCAKDIKKDAQVKLRITEQKQVRWDYLQNWC